MTRGRYAARAANRLAALDNDLLRDKAVEVEHLTARIADLEAELAAEKRDRDALILARAGELSAQQIAAAHTELHQLKTAHQEFNRETATWFAKYINGLIQENPDGHIFPMPDGDLDYEVMLHRLVGQEIGEYVALILGDYNPRFTTREYRRMRRKDPVAYREIAGFNDRDRKRDILTGIRQKTHGEETP
jgi:hypothetical protein